MNPQRAQRKIQLVLNHDQVRLRIHFVLPDQFPDRQTTQVHVGLGLRQQHRDTLDLCPRRNRPALPVPYFNPQVARNAINRQEAQVMRRELILDTGIAETDDQFHATIPNHVAADAFVRRVS